jgi:hypothetical protein
MVQEADNVRLHQAVNKALGQWVRLEGVDPTPNANGCIEGDYQVVKNYGILKEAQELDETGLTTCMVLRAMVEERLLDKTFTLHDLLNQPAAVEEKLRPLRDLIGTLEPEWVTQEVEKYVQRMKDAVAYYKVDSEEWKKAFDDKMSLAWIRRDALKSFKEMRTHQFVFGEHEDVNPKYNEHICQFWNVNSLLAIIGNSPVSGVTLCVVRDSAVPEFSYFVFAIRNGGNLILLTDKTVTEHPLQKFMSRRPGRDLENRMFKHHFPYQLIGAELVGGPDCAKMHGTPGLVKYQAQADIIGHFNAMKPDQILWAILILEKIRDEYWVARKCLPSPSFTGEMIQRPQVLLDSVKLPVVRREVLEMPHLTVEDIGQDKLTQEGQWETRWSGRKPTGVNRWMEDRYGHLISEEHLNLLDDGKIKCLLSPRDGAENDKGTGLVEPRRRSNLLTAYDPTEFGTKEEILKDYKWHARHNQAVAVNQAAHEEFREKKDEVFQWYESHVRANVEVLKAAIGKGEFITEGQLERASFDWTKPGPKNILNVFTNEKGRHYCPRWGLNRVVLFGRTDGGTCFCFETGLKASVFAEFEPRTPQAIADLCGCKVEDLPFFLQYRYENDPYTGNHLLERVDPMEWAVENPWKKLDLRVVFLMTRKVYNGLRKVAGREVFADWESIESRGY